MWLQNVVCLFICLCSWSLERIRNDHSHSASESLTTPVIFRLSELQLLAARWPASYSPDSCFFQSPSSHLPIPFSSLLCHYSMVMCWEHNMKQPSASLAFLARLSPDPNSLPRDEPQVAQTPAKPIAEIEFYRWTLLSLGLSSHTGSGQRCPVC